jgi:hypothetical protein
MQKNDLNVNLTAYTKTKSMGLTDLNLTSGLKLLKENIGKSSLKLALEMIFWVSHQKPGYESKNKQERPHQTKKFVHSKGNNQQMKKQPTNWKKIVCKLCICKGLIVKTYKEFLKLITRKISRAAEEAQW